MNDPHDRKLWKLLRPIQQRAVQRLNFTTLPPPADLASCAATKLIELGHPSAISCMHCSLCMLPPKLAHLLKSFNR
jgi:hypothetical protein